MPNELDPRASLRFYEIVRIQPAGPDSGLREFAGREAAVTGVSVRDDGVAVYQIHIYGEDVEWSAYERDLEPTGRMDSRENFVSDTTIRVSERGEVLGVVREDGTVEPLDR